MKTKHLFLLPGLIVALGLTPAGRLTAQTFSVLHSFTATNGVTEINGDGAHPRPVLILSGSTLYGTALYGGSLGKGTVFAVNTDGTGFTNLHSFTGSDGSGPRSGLTLSGNTLYGTAYAGGSSGAGTVFKVNTDGTGFTTLHDFTALAGFPDRTNSDGANPRAGLILAGNTLYGTAINGGSSGAGTVFAVTTNGTGFTTLHNFVFGSGDGTVPYAALTSSGDTLYGTTEYGGSSDSGTVFAINTDGTGFTTLHSFTTTVGYPYTNSGGAYLFAGLILSGGTLYGTAYQGGSFGGGTVFAVNTNGTGFTTVHSFRETPANPGPYTNSDGAYPYASLLLSGNALYGTAFNGGSSGNGTVFRLSFGSSQADSLLQDGDFNLLALGTAPDVGVPAGHWSFPPDYVDVGAAETNVSEFSIAVAPGGTNGNSLHLSADATILGNQHLPNMFTQSVNKGAGLFLVASFDLYVAAGHGGGYVYLGNGGAASTNRGPQIAWDFAGDMFYTAPDGSRNVIGAYLQGIWQSARIEVDVDNDRYNFYAGPRGFAFSVISSNLPYRSGPLPFIDRFTIGRFDTRPDADAYFDNIVVELAPVSPPQLAIIRSGDNVVLTWPDSYAGFVLQSTTNLVSPDVWTTHSPASAIVNGQFAVTNPITGPRQFYRLSR